MNVKRILLLQDGVFLGNFNLVHLDLLLQLLHGLVEGLSLRQHQVMGLLGHVGHDLDRALELEDGEVLLLQLQLG